ncbi:MAG: preprotein translocase subunit SecG [Treponema sp.]|nr:preprotein translocase subunit SecG [Treponema sp.]
MSAIGIVLLVFFIIVCVLLVLLVAIQDDGENGMGGLLGGRGTAAFGSHSASVLTKTTFVLVILFFVLALGLALVNKKGKVAEDIADPTSVEAEAEEEKSTEWWSEAETTEESLEAAPVAEESAE